ncbi:hypothetical protein HZA56_10065 [Candidatus Poribacteria bacterium]|nr:hypothetical protein [Candidatus Poribacteria bacterium]
MAMPNTSSATPDKRRRHTMMVRFVLPLITVVAFLLLAEGAARLLDFVRRTSPDNGHPMSASMKNLFSSSSVSSRPTCKWLRKE